MGTINVKDAVTGSAVAVARIPDTGQATMANSLPVAIASDQALPLPNGAATAAAQATANASLANIDADLGAVGDAAASSDTGSFSLIALFKRALQNWTTLLARVPAVGQKAMAASIPVVLASDQSTLAVADKALARTTLLAAVTGTGAGSAVADSGGPASFTGSVTGTGAVSATVTIEVRNTASGVWVTLGTLTMSGTTTAQDAFGSAVRYMEYRANVTAISGTGAAVTVTMGS